MFSLRRARLLCEASRGAFADSRIPPRWIPITAIPRFVPVAQFYGQSRERMDVVTRDEAFRGLQYDPRARWLS